MMAREKGGGRWRSIMERGEGLMVVAELLMRRILKRKF